MGWKYKLLNTKPETIGRALLRAVPAGPIGIGVMAATKAYDTYKDKKSEDKKSEDREKKAVGGRVGYNKGGRTRKFGGGRSNLLEEVGRLDAERMNPNRRAEKRRVIGELNRGYNKGGRVGLKKGSNKKWIQKVNKSIKARGTKGKCTPITKPGCTGRAKALDKTFKKMAKKKKAA